LIQLEAYFSQAALFDGMQLLLVEPYECHYTGPVLSAKFPAITSEHGTLAAQQSRTRDIETRLDWSAGPLIRSKNTCCTCGTKEVSCAHMAAIAIDSQARQAPPLDYAQGHKRPDTVVKLLRSELNKRFVPYLAMVRYRIIYLLSLGKNGLHVSVHKGYVGKLHKYSLKGDLGFEVLERGVMPKFVTQSEAHAPPLAFPYSLGLGLCLKRVREINRQYDQVCLR